MSDLKIIVDELARNGKGQVATNANVEKVAPLIKTNAQALRALGVAETYLNKAYAKLSGYNLVDHAAGVAAANLSLLQSTLAFIVRLQGRIPSNEAAPVAKDANGTALVLLQAIDCLRITDLYTRDSSAFSYTDAFFDALAEVLDTMLKKVIVPTLKAASSIWVPLAIVAGGLLLVSSLKK